MLLGPTTPAVSFSRGCKQKPNIVCQGGRRAIRGDGQSGSKEEIRGVQPRVAASCYAGKNSTDNSGRTFTVHDDNAEVTASKEFQVHVFENEKEKRGEADLESGFYTCLRGMNLRNSSLG